MKPAIRIENLSKEYHISARTGGQYRTVRESLGDAARSPWRRLRRMVGDRRIADEDASRNGHDTFLALDDVSLEIQPGEVVGVIGRNGAGKSTLFKILSRITEPTSGRVTLRGSVGSLLEVGTGFHPELSGRENVYMNGSILGMSRRDIRRRFDDILAFAELERFIDTPVKRYSSGMYVRLAFSVAAHLDPEILIVDEVLAVGDASFQKKCLGKIREIATAQRTVLFVTHNMSSVRSLCSRACLLRSGQVVGVGPTADVLKHYLTDGSTSETGTFDLTAHPARSPESTPIIRRLTLRSANGKPTSVFFSKEAMIAEITIDTTEKISLPRLAVAIEDSAGGRIMTGASYFSSVIRDQLKGTHTFRCTVPSLGLRDGSYMVSVSIATKVAGLIDSIDCAAWFSVRMPSAATDPEEYQPVYGPVLCDSHWEEVSPTSPSFSNDERTGAPCINE